MQASQAAREMTAKFRRQKTGADTPQSGARSRPADSDTPSTMRPDSTPDSTARTGPRATALGDVQRGRDVRPAGRGAWIEQPADGDRTTLARSASPQPRAFAHRDSNVTVLPGESNSSHQDDLAGLRNIMGKLQARLHASETERQEQTGALQELAGEVTRAMDLARRALEANSEGTPATPVPADFRSEPALDDPPPTSYRAVQPPAREAAVWSRTQAPAASAAVTTVTPPLPSQTASAPPRTASPPARQPVQPAVRHTMPMAQGVQPARQQAAARHGIHHHRPKDAARAAPPPRAVEAPVPVQRSVSAGRLGIGAMTTVAAPAPGPVAIQPAAASPQLQARVGVPAQLRPVWGPAATASRGGGAQRERSPPRQLQKA